MKEDDFLNVFIFGKTYLKILMFGHDSNHRAIDGYNLSLQVLQISHANLNIVAHGE